MTRHFLRDDDLSQAEQSAILDIADQMKADRWGAKPLAGPQSVAVIFVFTYILTIAGFSHSIVGSSEAFLLLFAGQTGVAQTLAELVAPAVLGNLVGGAGIFAVLAHGQVRGEPSQGEEQ